MRRAISDLLRPRNNVSSLRNRATNGNKSQRRHNSNQSAEKNEPTPASKESPAPDSAGSSATVPPPPPPAGSVTSSAGAATPPLPTAARSRRSLGEIIRAGPIGRFGNWYTNVQHKRPYTTQLASSLIIYMAGDLSAQLLFPSEVKSASNQDGREEGKEESVATVGYDPMRTLRHLTVGLVSSIPSYKWFMFLHHNFNYTSKFLSITTKVAVQQAVFTPVFNTYFFSMQSLLAGASIAETWERLKLALPNSIKNSVKLWPAITAFSFMYVPPHFRSVFGGTIAVGWQTYLSWLNQKAAREVAAAEAAAGVAVNASSESGLRTAESRISHAV